MAGEAAPMARIDDVQRDVGRLQGELNAQDRRTDALTKLLSDHEAKDDARHTGVMAGIKAVEDKIDLLVIRVSTAPPPPPPPRMLGLVPGTGRELLLALGGLGSLLAALTGGSYLGVQEVLSHLAEQPPSQETP